MLPEPSAAGPTNPIVNEQSSELAFNGNVNSKISLNDDNKRIENESQPPTSRLIKKSGLNYLHLSTAEYPWIDSLFAVRFDITDGQTIESFLSFSEENNEADNEKYEILKKKISFLALPDHNTGNDGDMTYTFRLPITSNRNKNYPKKEIFFGAVFYRQIRSKEIKRGYFQKSVVVLSKLPFTSCLEQCAKLLGPLYFDFGKRVFKDARNDIVNNWSKEGTIRPNEKYCFNLAGSEISFRTPLEFKFATKFVKLKHESETEELRIDSDNVIDQNAVSMNLSEVFEEHNSKEFAGEFLDTNLFSIFGGLSVSLWHMWELILLGKPIIVISKTPEKVSKVVLALISLISPLTYSADFRPYFTIYDDDFRKLIRIHSNPNSVDSHLHTGINVLGVTNPYFLKALQYWPNVISVCDHHKFESVAVDSNMDLDLESFPNENLTTSPNKNGLGPILSCFSDSEQVSQHKFLERDYIIPDEPSSALRLDDYNEEMNGHSNQQHKVMKRIRSHQSQSQFSMSSKRRDSSLTLATNGSNPDLTGLQMHNLPIRLLKMKPYEPVIAPKNSSMDFLLSNHDYEQSIVVTRRQPLVEPSYNVLNQLFFYHKNSSSTANDSVVLNNQVLRQHFMGLTNAFLKPLEEYLNLGEIGNRAARKSSRGIRFSAYNAFDKGDDDSNEIEVDSGLRLSRRFNVTLFLKYLDQHPPTEELLLRNYRQLYEEFILGPNFKRWYFQKVKQVDDQLNIIYRELRLNIDAKTMLQTIEQEYKVGRKVCENEQSSISGYRKRIVCFLGKGSCEDDLDMFVNFDCFRSPENELIKRIEDAIKIEQRHRYVESSNIEVLTPDQNSDDDFNHENLHSNLIDSLENKRSSLLETMNEHLSEAREIKASEGSTSPLSSRARISSTFTR